MDPTAVLVLVAFWGGLLIGWAAGDLNVYRLLTTMDDSEFRFWSNLREAMDRKWKGDD